MDPGARRDVGTPGTRLFEGQDRRIVSVNCQRQISHKKTSRELHVLPGQKHRCDQMRVPGAGNYLADCSTIEGVFADARASIVTYLVKHPRRELRVNFQGQRPVPVAVQGPMRCTPNRMRRPLPASCA